MTFLDIDFSWAFALNSYVASSSILTPVAIFGASYIQYLILLVLFFITFKSRDWFRIVVLSLVAAFVARIGIKELVLQFIERARPFYAHEEIQVLIPSPLSEIFQSFPSGHTIFFFALATVVYLKDKKCGAVFYGAALIIGVSRVAVGVHYPSDILAGAVLGIMTGCLTYYIYKRFIINQV
jgi:undecaprenyl-diphosphatase